MHNPIRGIVTSEHQDDGGYKHHRGRDIGTRDLNNLLMPAWVYGVGRPVYAAFSGRWKKIHRSAKHGNKNSTWAPTRTGNGGLVANPDGEGNGYNHVLILPKWDEGDWINEGELIGHLDLSGNMSAPHLHFEMWLRWQDPYSDYSPKIVFDKHGISTMDDPTAPRLDFAGSKPSTSTPTEPTGGLTMSEKAEILDAITALDERLKTHDGNSWDQRRATETQINAVDARLKAHDGNSWSQFRQTQAAVFGPLEVLANTPGVTVEELRQAIAETAVTVDVNVTQKEK